MRAPSAPERPGPSEVGSSAGRSEGESSGDGGTAARVDRDDVLRDIQDRVSDEAHPGTPGGAGRSLPTPAAAAGKDEEPPVDLLRIVLSILLPPLGVFLQVGFGLHFWLNIVLTILGYIPGIVHAVWIIARR